GITPRAGAIGIFAWGERGLGRFASREAEPDDWLRLAVVVNLEIGAGEIRDGLAMSVERNDVQFVQHLRFFLGTGYAKGEAENQNDEQKLAHGQITWNFHYRVP